MLYVAFNWISFWPTINNWNEAVFLVKLGTSSFTRFKLTRGSSLELVPSLNQNAASEFAWKNFNLLSPEVAGRFFACPRPEIRSSAFKFILFNTGGPRYPRSFYLRIHLSVWPGKANFRHLGYNSKANVNFICK